MEKDRLAGRRSPQRGNQTSAGTAIGTSCLVHPRERGIPSLALRLVWSLPAAVELYNTLTGLIIAYVTICLPFAAWMSKGYFDSIPRELDEAGLVDGASRLQIFLRIIMPIALPGTVATLLFAFLLAWQDLLWALCLISIDAKRTVTLGVAFAVGEFVVKWPMLTAASLIGSLPTLILYLALQRFYVEGLARGAVKG